MGMKFHRDGNEFDYLATKDGTTFGLSHEFGVWYVWINGKEQGFFDTCADAKEFCRNYKDNKEEKRYGFNKG